MSTESLEDVGTCCLPCLGRFTVYYKCIHIYIYIYKFLIWSIFVPCAVYQQWSINSGKFNMILINYNNKISYHISKLIKWMTIENKNNRISLIIYSIKWYLYGVIRSSGPFVHSTRTKTSPALFELRVGIRDRYLVDERLAPGDTNSNPTGAVTQILEPNGQPMV